MSLDEEVNDFTWFPGTIKSIKSTTAPSIKTSNYIFPGKVKTWILNYSKILSGIRSHKESSRISKSNIKVQIKYHNFETFLQQTLQFIVVISQL